MENEGSDKNQYSMWMNVFYFNLLYVADVTEIRDYYQILRKFILWQLKISHIDSFNAFSIIESKRVSFSKVLHI